MLKRGKFNKASAILSLAIYLIFLPVEAIEPIRLKRVVVFGDSLADTGNTQQLFQYFRGVGEKPWFYDDLFSRGWGFIPMGRLVGPMPPEGYYRGRFSNGPLASEMSVEMLGLDTLNPEQFENLAFGGSWSVSSGQFLRSWLGLWNEQSVYMTEWLGHLASGQGKWLLPSTNQIADWYLQSNRKLDPNTLYTVASGSNDYQNGFWDVKTIVETQTRIIERLILSGARHIGWGTLPDLTITPCFHGSPAVPKILKLVQQHNQLISVIKDHFEVKYPQVKIAFADGYTAMNLFYKHAETFGFSVLDRGCTNIAIPGCTERGGLSILDVEPSTLKVCENPDEYFFWDDMHPTTRAYEHMAAYLCVIAGLAGYWTDCRFPENFDYAKAESLLEVLIDEGLPKHIVPDRASVEKLLHLHLPESERE